MRNSYALILLLLAVGCNTKQKPSRIHITEPTHIVSGEYYFDFNSVSHYSTQITEEELFDIEGIPNLSEEQRLKLDIILFDVPKEITDTLFIRRLSKIGFVERHLNKSQEDSIREIFKEKKPEEVLATTCVAIYRDLLIFKKEENVTGIAKICFDCLKSDIIGAEVSTLAFGQSGDYNRLIRILYR